jgi:hypothetical protein
MGARKKLNSSYFLGSLMVASLSGWFTQSWLVFGAAAVILLGANLHNGDIRLGRRVR